MNVNEGLSIIIVLTSIFAYVNYRWIHWPPTIGIMALSLISSLAVVYFGSPHSLLSAKAFQLVNSIDFRGLVMDYMLSFLLFAGAIHIDIEQLKIQKWPVLILSSVGVIISTAIVGILTWYVFSYFKVSIDFIYCLLFGALISPTDPIAVLGILKEAKIAKSLESKIAGESLFNDGVAVVLFIACERIAQKGAVHFVPRDLLEPLVQVAMGGIFFGAVLGYSAFWALRSIRNYKVEVLITLATVMGGYSLAHYLHFSGPLAMVVSGLVLAQKARTERFSSDESLDYLGKFWELIDEILNAILFLLIGLEMLIIKVNSTIMYIGLISIGLVLLARYISVLIPVFFLRFKVKFEKHAVSILTWGGLRGGVSVALALSLTSTEHGDEFVLITYVIVVFSILVQGLTIGQLAKRLKLA